MLDDLQEMESSSDIPSPQCINEGLLESHPMMWEELERLAPFETRGNSIFSYRGLSEANLLTLADQQDSAAMTVLGAMHEVRARDLPDSKAVPYLMLEEKELPSYSYNLPLSEAQVANLEKAAYWYYQAALHGRLMALTDVGYQLLMLQRNPVDLGWVSQEEYDLLSGVERGSFNAFNVYNAAVYTIAPELEIGVFTERADVGRHVAKRFADIVPPLVQKYSSDRANLGLPPISVPVSKLPPPSELEELLCESDDDP